MKMQLGNYYIGNSVLHRLDPRLKFVFSFIFMVQIFTLESKESLFLYGALQILLIYVSKIPLKRIYEALKPIFFLIAFAFVLNLITYSYTTSQGQLASTEDILFQFAFFTLTKSTLFLIFRLSLRLTYMALTTSLLLTLVTSPIEIADALEHLCKPLERVGFPSHAFAMMLSIALRFVPILATEADKLMKAQSARGADFDTGSLWNRMKGMLTVLIPLFVGSFKRAEDLALAMEARCYRGGENRSKLKQLIFKKEDYAYLVLFSLVSVLLILFEFRKWVN